jgi:hypothetical protein
MYRVMHVGDDGDGIVTSPALYETQSEMSNTDSDATAAPHEQLNGRVAPAHVTGRDEPPSAGGTAATEGHSASDGQEPYAMLAL